MGGLFAERYEVEACVGQGAMGVVYRVHDREVGERVALKLLTVAPGDDSLERFRREVRLARRITSRHVARIHDLGEHDGAHFLTMEYVDGEGLDAFLRRGPVAPSVAARLAVEIAAGLDAAHEVGVVHRDLKPANVLLERAGGGLGRAVLTDFGIARALREDERTHDSGVLVGTPAYMAPEQVLSQPVDARTDVYALGLTLYELLTGVVPFVDGADGILAVALARCHRDPVDPRRFRDVPAALADLVLRCLAREPDARPARASDVAESLVTWLRAEASRSDHGAFGLEVTMVADSMRLGTRGDASGLVTSRAPGSAGERSQAPFAPLPVLQAALAVLPFRVRGSDDAQLGWQLQEELVDVLSRTRGLRIASSAVVGRYVDERDPLRIGRELRVESVVDGTLQRIGDRLRVTVRLLDATTGVQSWSERHEVPVSEALMLEDTLARRVAESLRVEIATARPGEEVPATAVESYLAARREMRSGDLAQWHVAVEQLERALEIAPRFRVALAAHAIAVVRAWWASGASVRNWAAIAPESVERAVAFAPELAETHLASAMLAVQRGDLSAGATELGRALDIAPTFAEAHSYLGELQCEAGRVEEGRRRLRLALELQPESWRPHASLARVCALRGDIAGAEAHIAEVQRLRGDRGIVRLSLALRLAAWTRDEAALRALVQRHAGDGDPVRQGLVAYGRCVLRELDSLEYVRVAARAAGNPRMSSLVDQLAAEAYGLRGEVERSLECVRDAAKTALVDLEWLERCSALDSVRTHPDFIHLVDRVQARVAGVWSLG
ncbi:MAG: protein kinase [Deltaproteobacteria bacterium]|nr:protein kinase [Deltaproteobacteria bacterium]